MKKLGLALLASVVIIGCTDENVQSNHEQAEVQQEETASIAHTKGYNELKNPYFGLQHLHTGWSFDEAIYNTRLGPENLYRHGRGEKVKHPSGQEVQLRIPLDFVALSEHAEYMGAIVRMFDPNDPLSKHPLAKAIVESGNDVDLSTKAFYGLVASTIQPDGSAKPDTVLNNPKLMRSTWDEYIKITDAFYEPGKFTTIPGFEWSSQPNGNNLHRVVLYRTTENLPIPVSYFDFKDPEKLWAWMESQREQGIELTAIPHNGNLSNGLMYDTNDYNGNPISKAYAETRARNEKITEIVQIKGQSETHPLMTPNDEFAGFEIWTKPVAGPGTVQVKPTNYVREAYKNGMLMEQKLGVNPFKLGVVGGGDVHTSIVSHEEYQNTGDHNLKSSSPEARLLQSVKGEPSKIEQGTAGLSCVWAEENTRESIYDALIRKETWATSGSRITVRIFGGYDFYGTQPGDSNWVGLGYKNGVPMGADLPENKNGLAPQFMIWALKGPNSGNLDRIQVIKGWIDTNGKSQEEIINVVWAGDRVLDENGKLPSIGNSVNIPDASYTNTIGSAELKTLWSDPEFDSNLSAFYYVRVIEIPTPRWSTYDAKALGIEPPKEFPTTIQERAWSSPIWYTPNN